MKQLKALQYEGGMLGGWSILCDPTSVCRMKTLSLVLVLQLLSLAAGLKRTDFPASFIFGTGTSAYQVEGAFLEDNKGLSNWDYFSRLPGKIIDGQNGDVADDQYHLYKEDIFLMHSLGVDSYRLSISWARILPMGRFGEINREGIAHYNDLIDSLLQKGIQPFVTICHYDIPQELEYRYRSWLSPEIQQDYAYYAEICFKEFGDRVKLWTTFNEPNILVKNGYMTGRYPPGRCSEPFGNCTFGDSSREPYIAAHNIILSHAAAAAIYKNTYQAEQGGAIGLSIFMLWFEPLNNTEVDIAAVQRALLFDIGWYLDPFLFGDYPLVMREILGSRLPTFSYDERRNLQNKLDFVGINHYTTFYVKDCIFSPCKMDPLVGNALVLKTKEKNGIPIGAPTGNGLCVVPYGIEKIVQFVMQRYNNTPMYITENGYSTKSDDSVSIDDVLDDKERIDFHQSYLSYLVKAIRQGADVRGYFIWSFIDNFEWEYGYTQRLGLYHVDFKTLDRTPKKSAKWYKQFLTTPGSKVKMDKNLEYFA